MTNAKIVILSLATVDAAAILLVWFFTGNALAATALVALCTLFGSVRAIVDAFFRWRKEREEARFRAIILLGYVPGFKYQGVD